jgi:arylsulfatase A-like enzyme
MKCFCSFLFWLLTLSTQVCVASERPNVLVILVDDMGYSDIGCFGSEINTPHIDRLAASGIRYNQFYNTAKCYTTRASLLTGLYHQNALNGKSLNDRCVTLAEVLRDEGYQTGLSGKWHLSGQDDLENESLQPLARGFDHFYGTVLGAGSYFDPYTLQRQNERIEPGDGFYYTDAITENAVERVEAYARAKAPFFQYVAYTAPHWPMHIPGGDTAVARYEEVYSKGWDVIREERFRKQVQVGIADESFRLSSRDEEVPAWANVENRTWEIRRMAVYAAMLERVDQGVGQILASLDRGGILDNTLVLFLSDNGGSQEDISPKNGFNQLGGNAVTGDEQKIQIGRDPSVMPGPETTFQGYGKGWANASNTPFRFFKIASHEGGIATPLIAHWPAGIKHPGSVYSQVGHVIDLMPTILETTQSVYPKNYQGNEILPLDGESLFSSFKGLPACERTLFWEYGNRAAIRSGDWKLVTTSMRDRNWELYDLARDRSELQNLASTKRNKFLELAEQWETWAQAHGIAGKPGKARGK